MTARVAIRITGCLPGILAVLAASAHAASEDAGLPQLDFATWPTQIFWLVITFGVLYLLMWKLVTPRIASVLEERRRKINDDMRAAREATEEAETMRQSFEAKLHDARMEAIEATRTASTEAKAASDAKNAEAVGRLNKKLIAAENEIRTARARALEELDGVAAGGAADAVAALAGITVSPADARKAVAAIAAAKA